MVAWLFFGEHGCQKSELGLDFGGVGDGIGDFLAEQVAVAFAEPVNCDFERALGGVHFTGEGGVRGFGLSEKEDFETIEVLGTTVLDELVPQSFYHPVEHGKSPT